MTAAAPPQTLQVDFAHVLAGAVQDEQTPDLAGHAAEATPVARFGDKNSLRWYVHGGGGFDIEGAHTSLALLGGGVSYFVVKDLSFLLELNTLYFDQPGPDAFGLNLGFLFRWHFVSHDTWSMYVEGGAGIMGVTEQVPAPADAEPRGGSKFNFTPQLGTGFSWEIAANVRLLTGVRWYHVSNARTQDNNPGLDSFVVYGGVTVPF